MNLVEKLRLLSNRMLIKNKKMLVFIERTKIRDIVKLLNESGFDTILSITVIDIPEKDKFILRYVFSRRLLEENVGIREIIIETHIPRNSPTIDSISDIYMFANYLERECYEMFGIRFIGNERCRGTFFLDKSLESKFPLRKI